jgi:hypothetical protein
MSFYVSSGGAYDQNQIFVNLVNAYDSAHQIAANPGTSPQPAFDQTTPGRYVITKTSACVIALVAPTAGRDDGLTLQFLSNTAFAHQVTFSGSLQDGAGHTNQCQFPAQAGAMLELVAFNGKWNVVSQQGTFTDS